MTDAKPRVLVVDDDALIRMNTCDMLDELEFASIEAGTGEEALTILGAHPVVVMIADLELPGMSGEKLVQRVRALHPELRIIVATGHSADRFADSSAFAGITFLAKPFDLPELRRAIEQCGSASGPASVDQRNSHAEPRKI